MSIVRKILVNWFQKTKLKVLPASMMDLLKLHQKFKKLAKFNQKKISFNIEYNQELYFRNRAHDIQIDWQWNQKGFNRISLVNRLVNQTGGLNSYYLEIGCANNDLFDSIPSFNKIGVDPVSGGTHRMTSDQFFSVNNQKFDVIFIDGLHEFQQVRRDALNALDCINDNGWIAFHDFLPSNWKEQHVPRISESWTGDCWKLAVELSRSNGIEFKIVNIDHGVGLMRKTSANYIVPDLSDELISADFRKFFEIINELPICDFKEAMEIIG